MGVDGRSWETRNFYPPSRSKLALWIGWTSNLRRSGFSEQKSALRTLALGRNDERRKSMDVQNRWFKPWPFWDGEWKRDPNSKVVGDQPKMSGIFEGQRLESPGSQWPNILGHWILTNFYRSGTSWQMERSHQHPWGPGCEFVVDGLCSCFERFHLHGSPGILFKPTKIMINKKAQGFSIFRKKQKHRRSNLSIVPGRGGRFDSFEASSLPGR